MIKKLLVPLDGSSLSELALPLACQLAQDAGKELILLRIPVLEHMFIPIPEETGPYGLLWPDQALERSRADSVAYLESIRDRISPLKAVLRIEVALGDPASVIQDFAREQGVDLILMSTHGYSGFTRWVLGSVTEKVLRGAPCPVLVMRDDRPLDSIMITLDGSHLGELALKPGLELASQVGARVTGLAAECLTKPSSRPEPIWMGLPCNMRPMTWISGQASRWNRQPRAFSTWLNYAK